MKLTLRRGSHEKYLTHKEFVARRKRENKLRAVVYKGGRCSRCDGFFHPSVYDFHHLDPSEKLGRASLFLNWKWERVKEEVDKCVLLCANCHREVHYNLGSKTTQERKKKMNEINQQVEAVEANALELPEQLRVNPETGEPVDVILVQSEDSVGTED